MNTRCSMSFGRTETFLPTETKTDKFYYYVLPFQTRVWAIVILMPIYFILVLAILSYLKVFDFELVKNFLIGLDVMINRTHKE